MDPNATLEEIRRLFGEPHADKVDRFENLSEAERLFTNLDNWLSEGGFKPSDWSY